MIKVLLVPDKDSRHVRSQHYAWSTRWFKAHCSTHLIESNVMTETGGNLKLKGCSYAQVVVPEGW